MSAHNWKLIKATLAIAVPLRIAELQALPMGEKDIVIGLWREGAEDAGVFSEAMLYRCGKPGDSARAFNGLAKALAALAHHPGGVKFGEQHFIAPTPANWVGWALTQE